MGWLEKVYRWAWGIIGGRPWTYIMRDIWHKYEGLCLIALVAIGALLGHWFWDLIFWILLIFALGFIAGHILWGKDYIPDQQGKSIKELDGKNPRSKEQTKH